MSGGPTISRRALLASLGAAAAWSPAIAAPERPRDVGIGGTGFAPEGQSGSDRGIGGTGFVGTIQRFGSIVVNDRRISYAPDVPVTIDGLLRHARDLRVGHVVRVVARPDAAGLATHAIVVERTAVGPVTAVYRDGIDVLGQAVRLPAGADGRHWRKGEQVAVSGLRQVDGTIVASLIEPAGSGTMRVVGPVERDDDGFWIGGLKLLGAAEDWPGRSMTVSGRIVRGGFRVADAAPASPFPAAGAFSVESYLRAGDGRLRLGSGLSVRSDAFGYDLSPWRDVRAVLDGRVAPDGTLSIDDLRLARADGEGEANDGRAAAPGMPGRSAFGRGAAGRGPDGFGPGGLSGPGGEGPGGRGAEGGGRGGGPGGGGHGGGGPGGGGGVR